MQALKIHLWVEASIPKLESSFDEAIKEFEFIKNEDEPCVYKKVSRSAVVFLVLYVDDILIIGNDIPVEPKMVYNKKSF